MQVPRLLRVAPAHSTPHYNFYPGSLPQIAIFKDMSNLLHEALERATLREAPGSPLPSGRSFSPNSHTSDSEDDNELISVRTAPPTPRSGSRAGSRSTSPTRKGRISRQQKELEKASSIDPLKRFPNEISSKIFTQITTVQDLLACQRVCKRWRKSATLNYSWFLLFNRTTFIDGGVSGGAQLPVWSRKDSKQDWAVRYKNAFRRDDLVSLSHVFF